MNARKTALDILREYDAHPGRLEALTGRAFSRDLDRRDRRFVQELVYGVIRHRMTLDFTIGAFLDNKKYLRDRALMRLLRLGAYQIIFLDRVPDHAAVNESVVLAKQSADTKYASGMVNAVLRKVLSSKGRLPRPGPEEPLCRRLAIRYSHPEWLVERWLGRLGLDKTRKLLSFFNERPAIYLRRRLKGISRHQFENENRDICDPAGGYLNLYYRMTRQIALEHFRSLESGACGVQSPSAGWVAALLDVQPGDSVLDMCASPGGKTALIAELAGRDGAVCACDNRMSRMKLLRDTIDRLGLSTVSLAACDGRALPFDFGFQKILLDAPCSGTGVMHRHPDARWVKKSEDFTLNAQLQQQLLDSAARHVTVGGVLVYATCSLEPEENELQVKSFLERNPSFRLAVAPAAIPRKYVDDEGCVRITPYEHGLDGMFGARFERTGS
jgi:16S rRNA (cytosine967-C5)-methyltransferase